MPQTFGRVFEIGGPESLSYETLLRQYAQIRGLHRTIISVPFLSLRLSSLWLFFVTNTSFPIARALVDSLTHETVCREDAITKLVPQALLTYRKPSKKPSRESLKIGFRPLGATPGLGAIIASTLEFDSRPRARCAARSAKQPLIEVGKRPSMRSGCWEVRRGGRQ